MEHVLFKIDERPLVCWDWRLAEKNISYLRGIDTEYYRYILDANVPHLEGDSRLQSGVAIRIAYYQGMETLFALLCAAIQAPDCVVGWNLMYRNHELTAVVGKITRSLPVYTHRWLTPATWAHLARRAHAHLPWPEEKVAWIQSGFGEVWERLAREFVDEKNNAEYNSLKHGLRPCPGGFRVAVGKEDHSGRPCPPERMMSLGGSDHGSNFYQVEHMAKPRHHFRPRDISVNWSPTGTVNRLSLIAMSIENVVSFLRIANGDDPTQCRFTTPETADAFGLPWQESIGVLSCTIDSPIREGDVTLWSQNEIAERLKREESGN